MYRALTSFTTKDYDIKYKQILQDDFTTEDEITEFLNVGYIEVYDGTYEITENGTYDIKDYEIANVNVSSGGGGYPDWSEIGYENAPPKFINTFNYSKEIYDNWDATVTSLSRKFQNDYNLVYMPLVDTGNVNNMNDMFNSCTRLTTIPLLDTSNVTEMERMFYNCYVLADIPVLDTSNVSSTGMYAMFGNTQGTFSDTSFNNILRMCINATKTASGYKNLYTLGFKASTFPVSKLETLSNYQDFLDAGWSTGY